MMTPRPINPEKEGEIPQEAVPTQQAGVPLQDQRMNRRGALGKILGFGAVAGAASLGLTGCSTEEEKKGFAYKEDETAAKGTSTSKTATSPENIMEGKPAGISDEKWKSLTPEQRNKMRVNVSVRQKEKLADDSGRTISPEQKAHKEIVDARPGGYLDATTLPATELVRTGARALLRSLKLNDSKYFEEDNSDPNLYKSVVRYTNFSSDKKYDEIELTTDKSTAYLRKMRDEVKATKTRVRRINSNGVVSKANFMIILAELGFVINDVYEIVDDVRHANLFSGRMMGNAAGFAGLYALLKAKETFSDDGKQAIEDAITELDEVLSRIESAIEVAAEKEEKTKKDEKDLEDAAKEARKEQRDEQREQRTEQREIERSQQGDQRQDQRDEVAHKRTMELQQSQGDRDLKKTEMQTKAQVEVEREKRLAAEAAAAQAAQVTQQKALDLQAAAEKERRESDAANKRVKELEEQLADLKKNSQADPAAVDAVNNQLEEAKMKATKEGQEATDAEQASNEADEDAAEAKEAHEEAQDRLDELENLPTTPLPATGTDTPDEDPPSPSDVPPEEEDKKD